MLLEISLVLSLLSSTYAQQSAYGQCGGMGWTGQTTCVSGYVCTFSNAWYSQCIPGTTSGGGSGGGSTGGGSTPPPPSSKANYWFHFGDSYSQTGFVTTGTLPAVGNPLGNPPYPGFTATGGPNWIDVMTTVANKSLILTYNYAYGGATLDRSIVPPSSSSILTVTDQVNEFLNGAAKKPSTSPWTSANAMFSIWIGINDLGITFGQGGDRSAFSDTLLTAYFGLVSKLVSCQCARNFLFITVPPVDRSPLMLAQSASSQALEKSVINTFNSKLMAKASAFQSANSGSKTFVWDANSVFNTILNNPTAYGFSDATSFGGAKSFWGNNYHPGSVAQTIFGKDVGALLSGTIF
ncbi:hypothetical protein BD410DRAFT_722017 [Rickenella mellea]|uniref:CBM1 domain-containing protein n=1 Tax=Rickenella mellea TaxID=50990 RepID=A0A4Y7Q5S0_9AGAM|nr:hypothetical protein BD410DRAFT_722017 [Rickenella mellea]